MIFKASKKYSYHVDHFQKGSNFRTMNYNLILYNLYIAGVKANG